MIIIIMSLLMSWSNDLFLFDAYLFFLVELVSPLTICQLSLDKNRRVKFIGLVQFDHLLSELLGIICCRSSVVFLIFFATSRMTISVSIILDFLDRSIFY